MPVRAGGEGYGPMSTLAERIALYKAGRWREALAGLPGWEDVALAALVPKAPRPAPAPTPTMEMVAHCLYHQTPPRERARCACGMELRVAHSRAQEGWCGQCYTTQPVPECPICTGRGW